jgi:hypothetical protein
MPRVPTEEEVLRRREARDWRARADALAKAVSEFLRVDTQCVTHPCDLGMRGRRAVTLLSMNTALADYLRTE